MRTKVRDFVSGAEIDADLKRRFPGLPRLVKAVQRRKRLLRALANWRSEQTQEEVAKRMGTTQPAIARLEQGLVDPKLSTLERYAAAMEANFVWQIVDDEGYPVTREFSLGHPWVAKP
jgi:transcriptional regulator with XRE-family HTH domain